MNSGELLISQADRRPMYLQIMEQIRHRIAISDWEPGRELPSIRALAASVQVSVITVKRAYLELEREGVIVTRHGIGSFVADRADLSVQLRRSELDAHLSAAADIGRQLGMTPNELTSRLQSAIARGNANDAKDEKDQ
jgi:GntR family transcriptional regulator